MAGVIAFVPIYWTHYFVLLLPALAVLGATVWQRRFQKPPDGTATALQGAWLIALVLLAVEAARWVGVHCWLALAVAMWAALRQERPTEGESFPSPTNPECPSQSSAAQTNATGE